MRRQIIAVVYATLLLPAVAMRADEFQVLPEKVDGVPRGELLTRHLLDQADAALGERRKAVDALQTPEQIAAYQERLRKFFHQQLGEFPARTPLNPMVTGRVLRDGFTVEKILFESRTKFFVTGALFLPDAKKFPPPYPAALVVCGHSANGKANDGYQRATAMLALNGIAGFIIDPVGQGERVQLLDADGRPQIPSSVDEHTLLGHGSVLLGRNTASFEVWDGMRAIDYLESREDIDVTKGVGCMGNSGGGTQTAYLMALDDRIACASPSCYITSFEKLLHTIGPQDAEQNIAGQVTFGMNHADYLIMRAPKPTLICSATKDYFSIEGARDSFAQAKRIYELLGHGDRVAMADADGPHGWSQPLREAATAWMVRWLRGEEREIDEPEIDVLTDAEINVTPRGQMMLLDGAVSAFDLNITENKRLAQVRAKFWQETPREEALEAVRRTLAIRPFGEIEFKRQAVGGDLDNDERIEVDEMVSIFLLRRDGGIALPLVEFTKGISEARWVVYVSNAKTFGELLDNKEIAKLRADGHRVIVVGVSGSGETASDQGEWYNKRFGSEGRNATVAYLLGKSLLAERTEDILTAVDIASQNVIGRKPVELIAVGELGPPALHAAALHPELFKKVRIERSLHSFTSVVETPVVENQWVHMIHGVLRVYDLPDLARTLGDKLELVDPVDASGHVLKNEK